MARVLRAVYDLLSSDQRRRAAVLLLLMLATAAFELIGIGSVLPFLSIAMDPTIIHRNEVLSCAYMSFGFSSDTTFILFGGLVMLAIIIVMNLVSAFTLWVQTRFVQGLSHSISVRLMGLYLAKPYTYFRIS